MSVTFPDGVSAQGNATLWYVPAIADVSAPTLAEINAGVNITCAIESFSSTSDQGTSTDVRYCTTVALEVPGRVTTSIDPLVYVYDPQDPENTSEYKAYSTMKQGLVGFLVHRLGIPFETAAASDDRVDVYPVTLGAQGRTAIDPSAEGSKIKVTQKPFVTGIPEYDAQVA